MSLLKSQNLANITEIKKGLENIQFENETGLFRNFKNNHYLRPKENSSLLSHYRDLEFELARLIIGWIPTASNFQLKMELGRQAYLMIEIVDTLESRLKEIPGGKIPIGSRESFRNLRYALGKARNVEEFLIGIYYVVQFGLQNEIEEHILKCDPIADVPTIDRLESVVRIIQSQIKWVSTWTKEYIEKNQESVVIAKQYVESLIKSYGGFNGEQKGDTPNLPYSTNELQDACAEPARLEEGYNIVEEFMFISPRETEGRLSDILYHNFAEIFVPDSLAYMIYDVDDMPYEFYRDFIRQLWDECRHTCMGVRELEKLGIAVKKLPINIVRRDESYTWLLATIGYTGEGCSFPRKLSSVDSFFKLGAHSAAVVTEYDIADESHHIKYIEKWLPTLHQKEKCEKSLSEIIEQAQRDALKRWSTAKRSEDYESRAKKLSGKFGKFGAFCKEVDFDINYSIL